MVTGRAVSSAPRAEGVGEDVADEPGKEPEASDRGSAKGKVRRCFVGSWLGPLCSPRSSRGVKERGAGYGVSQCYTLAVLELSGKTLPSIFVCVAELFTALSVRGTAAAPTSPHR